MTHCKSCGELVEPDQPYNCCGSLTTEVVPDDGMEFYTAAMQNLDQFEAIIEHIRSMPADSKKRRKLYNKPKDSWPGRLTPDTQSYRALKKSSKKPQKKSPSLAKKSIPLDITSSTQHKVSIVAPHLKVPDLVVGTDRTDARRLARKRLRDMGMSITTADEIIEEADHTTIIYR